MSIRTMSQSKLSQNLYNKTKIIFLKGSVYFDGTGDYLTIPSGTAFNFATSDFTIEAMVNPAFNNTYVPILRSDGSGNQVDFGFTWISSTSATLLFSSKSVSFISQAITLNANSWSHLAVSRSGTSLKAFVNGSNVATVTNSTNWSAGSTDVMRIGGSSFSSSHIMQGYISNLRVVKSAVYTSTFTVPTFALQSITNTSLLTCQNPDVIKDNGPSAITITAYGNAVASSTNPF